MLRGDVCDLREIVSDLALGSADLLNLVRGKIALAAHEGEARARGR
jgi:hypothetical protein